MVDVSVPHHIALTLEYGLDCEQVIEEKGITSYVIYLHAGADLVKTHLTCNKVFAWNWATNSYCVQKEENWKKGVSKSDRIADNFKVWFFLILANRVHNESIAKLQCPEYGAKHDEQTKQC